MTLDSFKQLKVIGRGSFGKVFLVQKKEGPDANKFYALKVGLWVAHGVCVCLRERGREREREREREFDFVTSFVVVLRDVQSTVAPLLCCDVGLCFDHV